MRLFVACHTCAQPIYIASPARVRSELPPFFVLRCQNTACAATGQDAYFTSAEVKATAGVGAPVGGAIGLGALGGLVGGPIGILLGALLGGVVGAASNSDAVAAANQFNNS